jgi:hypothetical protein
MALYELALIIEYSKKESKWPSLGNETANLRFPLIDRVKGPQIMESQQ